MRRTYREKIYRCGDYIDVQVFPVFAKGNTRRKKRAKPTSEMQARLNQRNAERALIRLLNANFTERDISVTLTFSDEHLPEAYEEAERRAKNFLRRVKRLRVKRDMSELKYIIIPGGGRFHFHIPMNGGIDTKELQALWPWGYLNVVHFEFNESGLEGHARYVASQYEEDQYGGEDLLTMYGVDEETGEVSETSKRVKGKRRYSCSKNIVRPEAEERDGRLSAQRVEDMATVDSYSRAVFEKLYPGYCFCSCVPYYNQENGGYYLEIRMYREDAEFLQTRKKYRRIRG